MKQDLHQVFYILWNDLTFALEVGRLFESTAKQATVDVYHNYTVFDFITALKPYQNNFNDIMKNHSFHVFLGESKIVGQIRVTSHFLDRIPKVGIRTFSRSQEWLSTNTAPYNVVHNVFKVSVSGQFFLNLILFRKYHHRISMLNS